MSTYNDAAYLAESIESVLSQDCTDFEFIIANDGSPDARTADILRDYAARDARIRVVSKVNEGLTKALIDGCAAARGEYIARLDVGDVMTPDRLRRQAEVLERHPGVVFVSCWTEFCGPEWEHLWVEKGKWNDEAVRRWRGKVQDGEEGGLPTNDTKGHEGAGGTTDHRPRTTDHGRPITGHRSPITAPRSPLPDLRPPASDLPPSASSPQLSGFSPQPSPAASVPGDVWTADVLPDKPGENLKAGPTHHGSVMMRADAHRRAGGYRWQFYYGQDWDLWYRLAELGAFGMVAAVLYRVRVLPEGISATQRDRQDALALCWREVCRCRASGAGEDEVLARAAEIRPSSWRSSVKRQRPSEGWYLVGEQLRRNGDVRCRRYLREAIRRRPADARAWLRLLQACVLRDPFPARSPVP
jgi:hypothetical protein